MKRMLAMLLALAMLFAMIPALGTTAKAATEATAAEVTAKPFYGLTWDEVDRSLFGNLEYAPVMVVYNNNGVLSTSGSGDYAAYAATIKTKLDALPEGMRYIRIFGTLKAFEAQAECVIYVDKGVAQLKALVTAFIEAYYAIGGKLDGIILDTEYFDMGNWYLYSKQYGNHYSPVNPDFYKELVEHPQYATEIRPLLEERGFVFHEPYESTSIPARNSELYSMYPYQFMSAAEQSAYVGCQEIWNTVMDNRMAAFMTDAVYEPMAARYPDAVVSDYQDTDSATWENYMSSSGGLSNTSGNEAKTGNVSNWNMYNHLPSASFFVSDGNYLYRNVQSYNKAIYEDDAYNSLMFNVNRFKSMYAATDTKKVSVWIAEYDYTGRKTAMMNSPYYTEFMYHIGLLDPLPFLVFMYLGDSKFTGDEGQAVYNERMEVISQILDELTRVAGYSDRKPIETPQSWNDGFMLSGMYTNGRNIWRLTPDTTDGTTLESFKVADSDPTFSINGNTITFPGGKILTDSTIQSVGSCGYWIETSASVQPIITREADRYVSNPSYLETFEGIEAGAMVNSPDTKPLQTWSLGLSMGSDVNISGKSPAAKTFTIPTAFTSATDSYTQKHQVWDMEFTIPSNVREEAALTLLTCGSDGGFKIANNKIYYDSNGSYVEMEGVTISYGSKYKVRRTVDFTTSGAFTCDYSLYDGSGNLIAEVQDAPMLTVSLPVTTLGASGKYIQKISSTTTDDAGNVTHTYANISAKITNATAGIPLYIEEYDGSNAIGITGTTTLNSVKLPKNITAGDSYAKQQAWEMSFVLPEALATGSVTLFNGGVKLKGSQLYYNANGTYTALADIAVGTRYTVNINNDFDACKATYTLSANGVVVARAEDITVAAVTMPVSSIGITSTGLTTKVYVDDYKLYPTGLEHTVKCYDASNGVLLDTAEMVTNAKVAYRLSWMNATDTATTGKLYAACYDSNGALQSETVLKTIEMKPGWDGVETGVLENTTGMVSVYLVTCDGAETELRNQKDATCTEDGYTGDKVCTLCGDVLEAGTVIAATGHTKVTLNRVNATCTETGLTTGVACSVCNEILTPQEVIPAKGHTEYVIAGKAATCTTAGKTDKIICSVCRVVLQDSETIPAGHTEVVTPGKAATCTEAGLTEGKSCSTCGEIIAVQTEIPALGHTETDPVKENVKANSCTEAGSYDLVVYCTVCGEEVSRETAAVEAVGHTEEILSGKAATCTETGLTEGKKCSACGEILVTQEEIPATGHKEAAPVKENVVAATDTENGSYDLVVYCDYCGEELSREPVIVPAVAPTAPTTPDEITAPTVTFTETYTVKIDGITYTISAYDAPVYSVNTTKTGYFNVVVDGTVTESYTGDYVGQVIGGDETSYNAKLIWHSGDTMPTLYLKGAIVDNYNEELGLWRFSTATNKYNLANAAIYTGNNAPLKIVVEADSTFQTYDGLHYQQDLTIESVGEAKLTLWISRTGILPTSASSGYANSHLSGFDLTLNANLTVSLGKYENDSNAGYLIRSKGGDIIVNGGNIVTEFRQNANKTVSGVGTTDGGNLYVNGGSIYSESYNTANLTNAAYQIDGNVYVSGGKLEAYSQYQSGVRAANIYITGGKVVTDTSYAGLLLTAETGVISVTGGAVEAVRRSGNYTFAYMYTYTDDAGTVKNAQGGMIPSLGEDAAVIAGATEDTASQITNLASYKFNSKYIKVELPAAEPGCAHTEQIVPGKAATCTEVGYTEGKICTTCGERTVLRQEIAALGHTEVVIPGEAATCTGVGYTDGKGCSACGELLEPQETIAALGHTEVVIAGEAATCTGVGYTEGKACTVCGEVLVAQEVIPALGHTAGTAVKENETETSYDSVTYCSVCGAEMSRQTITVAPGECTEHTYTDDNDAVCNNCGFVRQMVDTFDFVNYRIVFADSDTTHKNFRAIVYKLGDQTVADPSDEAALKAIDPAAETHWQAIIINRILLTDAGNYVVMLKYNVGTAIVSVPMMITVEEGPKMIIDANNKITALDADETHINHRVVVYHLGAEEVEDIYDTEALTAIDAEPETVWQMVRINQLALTDGGTYVLHYQYNIGTSAAYTVAQSFAVDAIPTLKIDVNNMFTAADKNSGNTNHRVTIYNMGDAEVEDIFDETVVAAAAASSETIWGLTEINKIEIKEAGNYIVHLYYNVPAGYKRTLATEVTLYERPVLKVTEENKLNVTYVDTAIITNPRATYYYFGENSIADLDIYDATALKAAATKVSSAIWTQSTINKTVLTDRGNYVIHLDYNAKVEGGSYKRTVAISTTIYDITKPTIVLDENNMLVAANENVDATNFRATIYNLGTETVEDPSNETALKAIDSAAVTKWGLSAINKTQLDEANNYVVLLKYNVGSATKTVVLEITR